MAKDRAVFRCTACEREVSRWLGQCPGCGAWNTLEEVVVRAETPAARRAAASPAMLTAAPELLGDVPREDDERFFTGIGEFDRVLGGGIVPGSLILLGGDPGVGKSTLLLQAAHKLMEGGKTVLYVSGEESARQIRMRADRLDCGDSRMLILCQTDIAQIEACRALSNPDVMVIDSIQTTCRPELTSLPGSITQVRESAAAMQRIAKSSGCSVFLVSHVTKEGAIAGPKVLEHMVDTVLYFEGDRQQGFRILRANKNRFGSVSEIGLFTMTGTGMAEVANPSEAFLQSRMSSASGSAVCATLEGTRPMLVDVQALISPVSYGNPRRAVSGVDASRVQLLLAVLEKRCGLKLSAMDAYVNIAGGLVIDEPAADLALCLAVASSFYDRPVPDGIAAAGEVGLAGEVRSVPQIERRISECKRLGFSRVIVSKDAMRGVKAPEGVTLVPVRTLTEALTAVLGKAQA